MSGWISLGNRGLDSLIGKVAGQEMRVSEKGDRNLRPKWKRPQALGAPGDRLPPGSPANCNPGARPRPRRTRRVDDMIDPDGAYCLRNRKCRHWYRRRWWWEAREPSPYWAIGHGLVSPDPGGHRYIATSQGPQNTPGTGRTSAQTRRWWWRAN